MLKPSYIVLLSLSLLSPSLWAETDTGYVDGAPLSKPIKPYGNNPNIWHVWAYKAQEGVINTTKKVTGAAEKGIEQVKPKAQQAGSVVSQKYEETKQVIKGETDQPAPIYEGSLSQPNVGSNTATPAPTNNAPTSYPVTDL